jgi:two-component system, NarL family, response regulator LiaR
VETLKSLRLLICDNEPAFRKGMCELLKEEKDIEIVGLATNDEEALRMTEELKPDLLVTNIVLPGLDGIEITRYIRINCPDTKVIICSEYNNPMTISESLMAGASAFITRDTAKNEIIAAIRLVSPQRGAIASKGLIYYMDRNVANKVIGKANIGILPSELKVLRLAAKGMSNKQIAKNLSLSDRTVQIHLINIYKKLKVDSRLTAVFQALKEGWINIDDLDRVKSIA